MPSSMPSTTAGDDRDESSSTAINALIGAIAGIVLSFIPLSTILGGAIAGYLEGGEPEDGVKVGAIAGLIMLIPVLFFGTVFLSFGFGFGPGGPPAAFGLMAIVVLVFGAIYTVGLGILGGFLGVYLKHEL